MAGFAIWARFYEVFFLVDRRLFFLARGPVGARGVAAAWEVRAADEALALARFLVNKRVSAFRAHSPGWLIRLLLLFLDITALGIAGASHEWLAPLIGFDDEGTATKGAILPGLLRRVFVHLLLGEGELLGEGDVKLIHRLEEGLLALLHLVEFVFHIGRIGGGNDVGEVLFKHGHRLDAVFGWGQYPFGRGDVFPLDKGFDGRGVSRGAADALLFHGLDDRGFVEGRLGLGEFLLGLYLPHRQNVPFGKVREGRFVLLVLEVAIDDLKALKEGFGSR